jgi:hypothetical protein
VVKAEKDKISAHITAPNYYGARYGLETLSQIIVYDEIRNELQVSAPAQRYSYAIMYNTLLL